MASVEAHEVVACNMANRIFAAHTHAKIKASLGILIFFFTIFIFCLSVGGFIICLVVFVSVWK